MQFWNTYFLLFIVVASFAVAKKPEESPSNDKDAAITGKLRMIHEKFGEGYTKGNKEYKKYMSRVLEAIGWASERVADKNRLYDEYQAYNKVRLDLEEQTMKRIEEIVNNILLNLPKKSKCVKFYSKQKDTLKKSLTSSNGDRPKILADNSKTCEL